MLNVHEELIYLFLSKDNIKDNINEYASYYGKLSTQKYLEQFYILENRVVNLIKEKNNVKYNLKNSSHILREIISFEQLQEIKNICPDNFRKNQKRLNRFGELTKFLKRPFVNELINGMKETDIDKNRHNISKIYEDFIEYNKNIVKVMRYEECSQKSTNVDNVINFIDKCIAYSLSNIEEVFTPFNISNAD